MDDVSQTQETNEAIPPQEASKTELINATDVHRGKVFTVQQCTFKRPDGSEHQRDIVRHPGAVLILPLLADNRVVLIRNDRPAVLQKLLELPAGGVDPGESPLEAAARELIEETGYAAESIEKLCEFYTTPGITDERMHCFVATGLREVGQQLQDGEAIEVIIVALDDVVQAATQGELIDAKSMLALLVYAGRRGAR